MFGWLIRFFRRLFGGDAQKQLPAPRAPGLTSLQVGDVVAYLDETYIVSQRIVNHANGFFWFDYQLDSGDLGERMWLSVEDDDELVVAFYRSVPMQLDAPPGSTLAVDGVDYQLKESGEADAKIERESGSETRTKSYSWDYLGPNGELLGVARWGEDEYEVMRGERVEPALLDLMPGS